MSADDPTDDELEREAARDVPMPMGNARHTPRLSTVSRAINPRAQLDAENRAQSGGGRGVVTAIGPDDEPLQLMPEMCTPEWETWGRNGTPMQGRVRGPEPRVGVAQRDERAHWRDHPTLGPPELRRLVPARRSGPEPPPETTRADAPQAWDRYVAAALGLAVQLGHDDAEGLAVEVADRLLEQRRRRFG